MHALWIGRDTLVKSYNLDIRTTADVAALVLIALDEPSAQRDFLQACVAAGLCDRVGDLPKARGANARKLLALLAPLTPDGVASANTKKKRNRQEWLHFDASTESFVSELEDLPDPDRLVPALLLARKRLCRVETVDADGKPVSGTGFLIGPSAIITNWHVVADGREVGGRKLNVVFDFGQTTGRPTAFRSLFTAQQDWLIGSSVTGEVRPDGAPDFWWTKPEWRQGWRAAHAAALDFAIIRVDGAPGLERGWYDLGNLGKPSLDGSCFVLHHPMSMGRTFTFGRFEFADDGTTGQRLFHSATSAHGSSGGLVLDGQGKPVGLHYLGLGKDALESLQAGLPPPSVPDEVVNVAVPLDMIRQSLLADQLAEIARLDRIAPTLGCIGQGKPVFGRDGLYAGLKPLYDGSKRVLWIQPPDPAPFAKIGKSYTHEILKALFPAPENIFVEITADQVKPGAEAMARSILGALSQGAANELRAPETSEAAFEKALVNQIRDILADRWPRERIWLVIDDLDVHDLTDQGGRSFLNQLYENVATIPQLRIVLIGLRIKLGSIREDDLVRSPIDTSDVGDIAALFETWIRRRGSRGKPLDPGVEAMFAKSMASIAGSASPLEMLGPYVTQHWAKALAEYFDT